MLLVLRTDLVEATLIREDGDVPVEASAACKVHQLLAEARIRAATRDLPDMATVLVEVVRGRGYQESVGWLVKS